MSTEITQGPNGSGTIRRTKVTPTPDPRLRTLDELEGDYRNFLKETADSPLDLARWLPSFRLCCRPLVPGDLVTILAATAVGKTAILQNIASAFHGIPRVLFELELGGESLFERFVGHSLNLTGDGVEDCYRKNARVPQHGLAGTFKNLLVVTEPGLGVTAIEQMSQSATLKLGQPPRLILVDYIQLMTGLGGSRYERFSDIAEGLRRMAKSLRAAVIVTSQVKRNDDEDPEVGLCDAKESGSIENSSSLVLGAWRVPTEEGGPADKMIIKVLKNTRGTSGREIICNWSPTLRIAERQRTITP